MRRSELFALLINGIGDDAEIVQKHNGWPGVARFRQGEHVYMVALHVGPIGLSQRKRDDTERRFQNPGQFRPLQRLDGMDSYLVGYWPGDVKESPNRPVIALMETTSHRFTKNTRQSYFVALAKLHEAAAVGWAEYRNDSDERIRLMWPQLLPAFIALSEDHALDDADDLVGILTNEKNTTGIAVEAEVDNRTIRAVRQVARIVRDARFARQVKDAYGSRCALCDLDYGLIEAAHILPVACSGSSDQVDNGICLCPNHHRAFDKHILYINPTTLAVKLHPAFSETLENVGRRRFTSSTRTTLNAPTDSGIRPSADNFRARYSFFERDYRWVVV